MTYLLLFIEFFQTGLFAVGGGMATIPFLAHMSEVHPEWFSMSMLANMIAISESTPGPIGINMATYVGFTVGGIPGALVATLSLVLPSMIVILIVSKFLNKYHEAPVVQSVFSGLRPAVAGLIAAAGLSVLLMALFQIDAFSFADIIQNFDWRIFLLFAVFVAATQIKKLSRVHPLVYIGIAAVFGMMLQL